MTDYTPKQWAAWALLGDPDARIPLTLEDMVERITQAINRHHKQKSK